MTPVANCSVLKPFLKGTDFGSEIALWTRHQFELGACDAGSEIRTGPGSNLCYGPGFNPVEATPEFEGICFTRKTPLRATNDC